MAVLVLATAARCKLCQHHRRADIDALLEDRSRRHKDADGNQINLDYVKAKFAEWGVENPTTENVSNHVKKHIEFVDTAVQEQAVKAAQENVAAKRKRGEQIDVDENLKWIVAVGREEIEERIRRGEKSGITTDHVLKATAELTRRSHNEAQHTLLDALVGGIGQALMPAKEPKQIEGAEVIDAEAEEVEA